MKQGNNYRLLQLRNTLFQETDECHELDIYELKERLLELTGVKRIDNRTIKSDLNALQEMDFDIVLNRRKHEKIYYSHQNKLFETYQIRLLVDAILSARFITINEKNNLINKLKELTSKYIAKTLIVPILFNQTVNFVFEFIKIYIVWFTYE